MTASRLNHRPKPTSIPDWRDVAKRVKARIDDAIPESFRIDPTLIPKDLSKPVLHLPRISGVLSQRELEITESFAFQLLPKLADKTYSSVEVTRAFCKRATIAHQATNCLAFIMFEEALKRAAELDDYLEKTGKTIGPLHGLPISVKEHVHCKGTPSTAGFIAWADMVEDDSLMVKIMRDAGAVFHVKTTNPQALMAIETDSNIYGLTTNPHNRNLSPGGSSGGEGALIAMKGSCLGIGTDMGGSIRVPAAFSGIYGLKAAIARNPHSGLSGNYGGMENIIGVVGPLANCVQDLRIFQEVALASEPWRYEPSLIRMPWNPKDKFMQLPKKLKVAIIWNDGVVQPHPPIMRALKMTYDALIAAGHEVIEWDTSLHDEIQATLWQMFFQDAGKEVWDVFEEGNEGPVPTIQTALDKAYPQGFTVSETWKINMKRTDQQTKYAKMWNETGIDFILAPVNPAAAIAHSETRWDGYTGVWNALDHTAITFPVTKVLETDTYENFPRMERTSLGWQDDYYIDIFKNGIGKYANAPVALQAIGRRHTEEKILKVVEVVEAALKANR